MQPTVRNTPITCPRCSTTVPGRERTAVQGSNIVTECQWRCFKCATFIKSGITSVKPKDENKG